MSYFGALARNRLRAEKSHGKPIARTHYFAMRASIGALLLTTAAGAEDGFTWHVSVNLDGKPLLCETTVCARHGRLLGIIGPSGAGKTTLLHAIAGALPTSHRVTLDGTASEGAPTLDDGTVALLTQEAGFFGLLTVRETLTAAAVLQPPRAAVEGERPPPRRDARVEQSLRSLDLASRGDVQVGDRSHRGVSGGESRRLAVGCELLGSPQLLIADEPTSGLDSYQAEKVVNLLHGLARERAIPAVATLHQPKSSIFHALDDLLLLAPGGRVAYHGPTARALGHFRAMGHRCPPQTNPAEFLIDLVSLDQDTQASWEAGEQRIDAICRRYVASLGAGRAAAGAAASVASADGVASPAGNPTSLRKRGPLRAARRLVRSAARLPRLALGAVGNRGTRVAEGGAARRRPRPRRPVARRARFHRRLWLLLVRSWRQVQGPGPRFRHPSRIRRLAFTASHVPLIQQKHPTPAHLLLNLATSLLFLSFTASHSPRIHKEYITSAHLLLNLATSLLYLSFTASYSPRIHKEYITSAHLLLNLATNLLFLSFTASHSPRIHKKYTPSAHLLLNLATSLLFLSFTASPPSLIHKKYTTPAHLHNYPNL